MKPSARIQSAIDVLDKIEEARIPMDNVLRDYMKYRRYIGSKDRKAVVELVYNIIRATARLRWWFEFIGAEKTSRLLVAAYLLLDGQSLTQVAQYFNDEKHAPSLLTDDERAILEKLDGQTLEHKDMPEDVLGECPPWAYERLKELWGDEFLPQMLAMQVPAALDLRVNTIKATVEKAQATLEADGIKTEKTKYSPVGLRALGKPYLSVSKAFHKGLVEIQDEGSQLIAELCGVEPGMRVLDYCAGSGGKTLALAARMEGRGIIYAMDNDSRRLEKGRKRYKKAGVHNVEVRSLEEEKNRKWLRRQKGTMDVVLVDAPCSSSGTWRRNPDLRWNQYGPSIDEIKEMQADILTRVADKVKPGGKLVYATCSLFREENEDQIERFMQDHPQFELQTLDEGWLKADYMRLAPKDYGTDGFFTAVLINKS